MAEPPRPPMTSLDAAWDDLDTVASDPDLGRTQPEGSAAGEGDTRVVSGEELDRLVQPTREGGGAPTDTMQLGGDEIEALLAKERESALSDPPPFASALDVPIQGGGLRSADEVADAFDRLEQGGGGPLPPTDGSIDAKPVVNVGGSVRPQPAAPAAFAEVPDRGEPFPSDPFGTAAEAVPAPTATRTLVPPPGGVPPPPPSSPGSVIPAPTPSQPVAPAAWSSPVALLSPSASGPVQGSPPRAALPRVSPRVLAVVVGAAATLAIATVLVGRLVRGGGDAPAASGSVESPSLMPSVQAVAAPPTTVSREAGSPEDDAIRALERFREGLVRCVRETIHVLPGTSPAVPASAAQLAGNGYTSRPAEWHKPVWACTRFQLSGPRRFQVQWQQARVRTEGTAVAWVDADGDGKVERAFGFHAKLKKRDVVEVGAIEPLDPIPSVSAPR